MPPQVKAFISNNRSARSPNSPVEEVMCDWLVDSNASLLLQDLLQSSEAVDHHHRVRVPQQAVQLVHHCRVWNNSIAEPW